MIFIGEGAILERAAAHAVKAGHCVDAAFIPPDTGRTEQFLGRLGITVVVCEDVNERGRLLASMCSDGIVFSINNDRILKPELLSLEGLRFYNVHNGITSQYRGLAQVCVFFAILNGETEYGATLHRIDAGVDTGPVLDVLRFPIEPMDDFATVMKNGVKACLDVFERNVDAIVEGRASPLRATPAEKGELYPRRLLRRLDKFRNRPGFDRATRLGPYRSFFPELVDAIDTTAHGS